MSSFLDSSSFSESLNTQDLQYKNAILTREKQNLINQVNQAMEISRNYNEVINENTKLKSIINTKDEKIKELEAQIDFNQQTINDLNKDLSIERTSLQNIQRNISAKVCIDDDGLKQQYKNDILKYKAQIEQLKNECQQKEINYKTNFQKCEKLFQRASEYFNTTVNSLDSLYSALSMPKQVQTIVQEKKIDSSKNDKEIQSLKLQIQSAKYKRKQLRAAILSQKKEIDQYSEKNIKSAETIKELQERQKCEISNYEKVNENLRNEIKALRQKINQLELEKSKPQVIIQHIPEEIQEERVEIKENNDELYKLQINNLKAELDGIKQAQKQLQTTVDKRDYEIEDLKRSKEELQMKSAADSEIIAEQKRTISSLQSAVAKRKDVQKIKCINQNQSPELVEEMQKLKIEARSNAQKASELELELTKAKSEIKRTKSDNENLKNQASDLQDTINELRMRTGTDKNDSKLSVIEVCSAAFVCTSIPPQLQTKINNIASNPALLTETKIQKVLDMIGSYIREMDANHSLEKEKFDETITSQGRLFKEFVVDVSLAVGDNAVTDISQPSLSNILSNVNIMSRGLEVAKADANRYRSAFDSFREIGCDSPEDAQLFAQQLQTGTSRLKAKLSNSEHCNERLKQSIKELKRENKYLLEQLQDLECAKTNEDELEAQNKQITELQDRLREKENQLAEAALHPKVEKVPYEQTPTDTVMVNELLKQIDLLIKSKQNLQKQYASLAAALRNAEAQNRAIACEVSALKASNEEFEAKLCDANERHSAQLERLNRRIELEKNSATNAYARIVEELRAQCESQRKTIEAITDQLAEAEAGLDEALADAADKGSQLQRTRMELDSAREAAELERRLSAARQSAELQELEAECNVRVGRVEAAAASDRRELIGAAMAAFRKFADVRAPANAASYKALLERVKERIEFLEKSDAAVRRILGISESHPIEDSVARIAMNL